ncbi:MAG: hypothetical protein ACD_75C02005G0003 [uncultured bacterium]|nr:MAG: hypothetical protein ACD_75C02005G0003 [uncultured bacterium]
MAEDFHYSADEYLLLGKITKAHGMRGEVKVFLYSGQPENIRSYKELFLIDRQGELFGPFAILRSRDQGKLAIVQFASVTDRNQAEEIEGRGVLLAKTDLPEIPEDEYYWHQYIGKAVVDVTGKNLGRVAQIFRTGLQDVLVIKGIDADEEILIPVTREIIVGETAGELTVDPPPGLLELNSGS